MTVCAYITNVGDIWFCPRGNLGCIWGDFVWGDFVSVSYPRGDFSIFEGDFNWGDFKEENFETLNADGGVIHYFLERTDRENCFSAPPPGFRLNACETVAKPFTKQSQTERERPHTTERTIAY